MRRTASLLMVVLLAFGLRGTLAPPALAMEAPARATTAAGSSLATSPGPRAQAAYAASGRRDAAHSVPVHAPVPQRAAAPGAESTPAPSGPGGGMVLACGIAAVLFMARRKLATGTR